MVNYDADSLPVEGDDRAFISETQKMLQEVDQECFKDTYPKESVEKIPASNKGALEQRYKEYAVNPSEDNLNALLAEVDRYARRVLIKGGYAQHGGLDDHSQIGTVKVWQNLKNFHGESKFSSWCNRIIKNAS